MPLIVYKEASLNHFPASVYSLSVPHQTLHCTRNVRHEISVGRPFTVSCIFGSHSLTRDVVSRAPSTRRGLQQVHKAQYGCFEIRQWPIYIYVRFLFRVGALGKSLNRENRNDIVNTLDRAGAKATFFLSRLPYYNLLSRVIHRSHLRRHQQYV